MASRLLFFTDNFFGHVLKHPKEHLASLVHGIHQLAQDPLPDGSSRKKLKGGKDVYRLRIGNYRLTYSFTENSITLQELSIRNEKTYRNIPESLAPPFLPEVPDWEEQDWEDELPHNYYDFELTPTSTPAPLPFELTREWLELLGVPEAEIPALLACTNEDELLGAPIESGTLNRVTDAIYTTPAEELLLRPQRVLASAMDLNEMREDGLLQFLLRLDQEQGELTRWALKGPTMIHGGAGTGKSLVSIYRVREVLRREGARDDETLLFTTYTNALLKATRELLAQILSPEQLTRVTIQTVDQVARNIVQSRRQVGWTETDRETVQRLDELRSNFTPSAPTPAEARSRKEALERLDSAYLADEFKWIISGRGLQSLQAYKDAPRPGRGIAFHEGLREAVWELWEAAQKDAPQTFSSLRTEALEIVQSGEWSGHWDHVFVDEAQDLSPTALALLAEVARTPEGIFFAADSRQSLYSRNYSWSSAHPRLQFRGKTKTLFRNYRSTGEINRAANDILPADDGEQLVPATAIRQGPLPILLQGVDPDDEAPWIVEFIRQMSRRLHLNPNTSAVLVPNNKDGEALAQRLSELNLPARFFKGAQLELGSDVVRVLTLHSAKGLEFPLVVVAGLRTGTYPVRGNYDDPGYYEEQLGQSRRLLHVGLSRAMRGLMLSVPKDCEHEGILGLNPDFWNVTHTA